MELFKKHNKTLKTAIEKIQERGFWSPYLEMPSERIYGENSKEKANTEFKALLSNPFKLDNVSTDTYIGNEKSPYGFDLGITYPSIDTDVLITNSKKAMKKWQKESLDTRTGIVMEILDRLNKKSFLIANSVMHTTGQPYVMAFQAGAPHAQDRGLEAVAYAYNILSKIPNKVKFEKPQGKHPPIVLDKIFKVVGRGISLVITCSTFPTWNSYSAVFASLLTGNSVIYKPHKGAILPIALTIKIAQEVLKENNIDTNLISLAMFDSREKTQNLSLNKDIKTIDFTGSATFGNWLEENAKNANVYTEKSGVNSIVIDDFDNIKGMLRNLSLSISLYSSQMCTAAQNIYIPKDGIKSEGKNISFEEISKMICQSIEKLLEDEQRAVEILGAIQNSSISDTVKEIGKNANILLESKTIKHPMFENAKIQTPMVIKVKSTEKEIYQEEYFGPILLIIECDSKEDMLSSFEDTLEKKGAITSALYSNNENFIDKVEDIAIEQKVNLSENLTKATIINHSAAFSDFHATGANKSANCSLSNEDFITKRYSVVTIKRDA